LIGLDTATLPADRWPEARKRWKQSVSAPLKVYTADEPIASLVTDPHRSPGPDGGVKIDRFVVQADGDGKKKIILKSEFTGAPTSLALSYDVSAAFEGEPKKRIDLGPLWIARGGHTFNPAGDQLQASIDRLDPSIDEADIILTPNPAHVEQDPGVSEIWGKKVILRGVPLERLDLEVKAGSK
jgi:hypothetical protein